MTAVKEDLAPPLCKGAKKKQPGWTHLGGHCLPFAC